MATPGFITKRRLISGFGTLGPVPLEGQHLYFRRSPDGEQLHVISTEMYGKLTFLLTL